VRKLRNFVCHGFREGRESARALVFFLSASFIVLGPAYRLVARDSPRYAIRWEMFSGIARDLYEVRFETTGAAGDRVEIDRFRQLGYSDSWSAPRTLRTVKRENEAWDIARSLCRTLSPNQPLFMTLRDATRAGWTTVVDGSQDVCPKANGQAPARPRSSGRSSADEGVAP
jgi:hypothetical protein